MAMIVNRHIMDLIALDLRFPLRRPGQQQNAAARELSLLCVLPIYGE